MRQIGCSRIQGNEQTSNENFEIIKPRFIWKLRGYSEIGICAKVSLKMELKTNFWTQFGVYCTNNCPRLGSGQLFPANRS